MSLKPICFKCQRFYRPKRNGIAFLEGMPSQGARPGTAEPEKWRPYKLWQGDLWECKGCGSQIIAGTGNRHIAEHHEKDFEKTIELYKATFQVNDC